MIGVYAVIMNIIFPYVTTMADTFSTSSAAFKNVFVVFFVGFIFISMLGGVFTHWGTPKLFVMLGGIISVVCLVSIGYAKSFNTLIGLVCLMGVGGGFIEVFATAAVAELYYPDNRRMLNFSQVFFCLGAIIMPMVSSVLIRHQVSYKISFFGASIFALLVVVYLGLSKYEHKTMEPEENNETGIKTLLSSPVFYLLAFGIFLYVKSII